LSDTSANFLGSGVRVHPFRRFADTCDMTQGPALNAYVFCFFFAASFLIAGKRPILQLSTRLLLVGVLALGVGYVLSEHTPWHDVIGTAALILNLVFIGFALIDYVKWHKEKQSR